MDFFNQMKMQRNNMNNNNNNNQNFNFKEVESNNNVSEMNNPNIENFNYGNQMSNSMNDVNIGNMGPNMGEYASQTMQNNLPESSMNFIESRSGKISFKSS